MDKKKIAVLLSGSGVYDGSEIHESVLTLLAITKQGADWQCIAPDIAQHHVVNHLNGEEMPESRNVLIEAARIARGNIISATAASVEDYDGLAMPGGFGAAKNWSKWAFSGPDGDIDPSVQALVKAFVKAGKPIAAMCMAPTTVAKALEGSGISAKLTVGNTTEASPYEIGAISQGMEKTGAKAEEVGAEALAIDEENRIISTPCYMMEADISQISTGIDKAVQQLLSWV